MICRAEEADLTAVATIEKTLFSMPWSKNGFLEALCNPSACLWVYKQNETVLGYLCMYIYIDEAEITNVGVEKEAQGMGIGKELVATAVAYARQEKLEKIVLEVRMSNASAIHVYETQGFQELGLRKGFYDQPKEDALIMAWTKDA